MVQFVGRSKQQMFYNLHSLLRIQNLLEIIGRIAGRKLSIKLPHLFIMKTSKHTGKMKKYNGKKEYNEREFTTQLPPCLKANSLSFLLYLPIIF